ncbi:hypothetical protein ACUH7Y_05420 [Clostridium beijerinckii]|uniref:Uncharacterized protein n=2 Tax=Clostridium beijerinckii TaxID=1520 RepID=A0A7X9SNA4_CLOBE|nr:hypothetical protein [Clostridium beijerinckii]NMF05031.1 hypothetical protein [Clostridium beijerinckii]NSB16547.1 hypothetical protein [Clostridium beijerinckii]
MMKVGDKMYTGKFICMICNKESYFKVRTDKDDYETDNYAVLEKDKDGTYKCEILAKCDNCKITQKIIRNINFEKVASESQVTH